MRSANARRFLHHPRRDPIDAGVFVVGTPFRHIGRAIAWCPHCGRDAVQDLFSATPETTIPQVPRRLSEQLPIASAARAVVSALCAECGSEVSRRRASGS